MVNKRIGVAGLACAAAVGAVVVAVSASQPAAGSLILARAELHDAAGASVGKVYFKGWGRYADRVEASLRLPADAPGLGGYHGFHVHSVGACEPPFTSAGGHWTLDASEPHGQHTGDLASPLVMDDGHAYLKFETDRFDVGELFDADGSAVILHAGPDNYANVPLGDGKYEDPNGWYAAKGGTASTGDAGGRYACGVVQR